MNEEILKINHVSKQYRLGMIGGTTLRDELQRKRAARKGLEDPTRKVTDHSAGHIGETFMALDDINITVHQGERVGIIGHNGDGKSTLLKLISRITAPSTGTIEMNGRVASMLEVGTGFHPELTGRENIYMNGAILGMTRKEIDAKIEDIIEFSECRQFIDTPVKRYSSGMYVKLAFSVAAHLDSEIMIMDEVLAVGDMAFQKKCLDKMNDVSKTQGRTILYVSHNMNTIRQLCERCIVLDHGKVVFDGEVEEAIEIYLSKKTISETQVNLAQISRDSEFNPHIITMSKLVLLNRESSLFKVGDKIKFRLSYTSVKQIEKTYIRIMVKTVEGVPITMFTVDVGFITREKKEEIINFVLDISRLVPGKYTLTPMMYEVDEYGTNVALDGLKDIYCFEIMQTLGFNNNMVWQPRYWGYFYNEPLSLLKDVSYENSYDTGNNGKESV